MRRLISILLLIPLAAGCSEQASPRATTATTSLRQVGLATHNVALAQNAPGPGGLDQPEAPARGDARKPEAQASDAFQPTAGRQIIYRASMNLHVNACQRLARAGGKSVVNCRPLMLSRRVMKTH